MSLRKSHSRKHNKKQQTKGVKWDAAIKCTHSSGADVSAKHTVKGKIAYKYYSFRTALVATDDGVYI